MFNTTRLPGMYCEKACLRIMIEMLLVSVCALLFANELCRALVMLVALLGFTMGLFGDFKPDAKRVLSIILVLWSWVLLLAFGVYVFNNFPHPELITLVVGIFTIINLKISLGNISKIPTEDVMKTTGTVILDCQTASRTGTTVEDVKDEKDASQLSPGVDGDDFY